MKMTVKLIGVAVVIGWASIAHAVAPDLVPPTSMQVDPKGLERAKGLDFADHPLSGSVNFKPNNFDVKLPGGMQIPVQDVVPFAGVSTPVNDCQDLSSVFYDMFLPVVDTLSQYIFPVIFQIPAGPGQIPDIKKVKDTILVACNNNPALIQQLNDGGTIQKQTVADVRNDSVGSTNVTFSDKTEDPYVEFASGVGSVAGVVVGGGTTQADFWNDGAVIASYTNIMGGMFGQLWRSSLAFYRFIPNAAQKKTLQFVNYGTSWLDKPALTNGAVSNPCFDPNPADPAHPVKMKSDADLVTAGCIGESLPVGIVAPNFFGHTSDKYRDLVVVSRDLTGDASTNTTKIGYITTYKRDESLKVADTSIFQDFWKFQLSVTNTSNGVGIPEPYGIATLNGNEVVVTSNRAIKNPVTNEFEYFIYRYANGMKEPAPIRVGCVSLAPTATCPLARRPYGPYKVYTGDINGDGCDDIALTRASIGVNSNPTPTANIQYAPYFDVFLQGKVAGKCTDVFDDMSVAGVQQTIPAIDPKIAPQISALSLADFNKDGKIDVMAGDFSFYVDAASKQHVSYVHFLENVNGILTIPVQNFPKFVVSTKDHAIDVGVIDIKADRNANLAAVMGTSIAFIPLKITPIIPKIENPCTPPVGSKSKVNDPAEQFVCNCTRDLDGDQVPELLLSAGKGFPNLNAIDITDCKGVVHAIPFDNTMVTLPDCTTNPNLTLTQTGRKWLMDWAIHTDLAGIKSKCDVCNLNIDDVKCTKPEFGGGGCYNPSQADSDSDGFGDTCDVAPNDNTQSSVWKKVILPIAKARLAPREDRVVRLDEGPVIANQSDLMLAGGPPVDPGNELTILLNKSKINPTPPPGDLCTQNPGLLQCVCAKDPTAPGCTPVAAAQINCCLDVCRGDLTAPFPAMCEFIRPYNDQIRKITGLCMDVLVPVEGTQYHLSCTLPNAPALDLGSGNAYTQVFKTSGQLPKNFFKESYLKPVADQNVQKSAILLNPADDSLNGGVPLDISKLPQTNFNFDPLLSVVPSATVNQAPGIAQIDGVMQIQTFLADVGANGNIVANPNANPAAGPTTKAVLLDIKGYSSPPGCQWATSDCPSPMPNPPSPQDFVNAIQAQVTADQAAGKAITIDSINSAFKSMDVGPAFLHQELSFNSGQGGTMAIIPMQNTMGAMSAEGGCGCTISSHSTARNTLEPLLMSLAAIAAMMILRRSTAKKH